MPAIETLLLCNHAEALNGLLYLSGAGWTDQHRAVAPGLPPPPSHFGVALTILVPWAETNRQYQLRLWIEPEDGGDPLANVDAQFEAGRPPGVPPGSDLRTVLAINAEVQWPVPGGYRLIADIVGTGQQRSVSFRIHDIPVARVGPVSPAA